MPGMTDPSNALASFQEATRVNALALQRGALDRDLFAHLDHPNGAMRLSYARFEGRVVTAFANFSSCDPVEGLPCFQAGVAVPVRYRGKGRAKDILQAAIREMAAGLGRNGVPAFYLEAIVHVDNHASRRVAEAVFSPEPTSVTDEFSGEPALQFLRRIDTAAAGRRGA